MATVGLKLVSWIGEPVIRGLCGLAAMLGWDPGRGVWSYRGGCLVRCWTADHGLQPGAVEGDTISNGRDSLLRVPGERSFAKLGLIL